MDWFGVKFDLSTFIKNPSRARRFSIISRLVLILVSPDLHPTYCPDISPDEYFVFLSVMLLPTPLL
jgi:hypothetical protein